MCKNSTREKQAIQAQTHLVARGKAAHTQGQKDPPPCMGGLGRVLDELLADLTVDLISKLWSQDAIPYDEVKLLQVGGGLLQVHDIVLASFYGSHHISREL